MKVDRIKYFLITIFVLLVFHNNPYSQIDTTSNLSFFPLEVGNIWHYAVYDYENEEEFKYYTYKKIIGDTLIQNKKYYKLFDEGNEIIIYYRIDSTNLKVYSTNENLLNYEFIMYDLNPSEPYEALSITVYPDTGFGDVGLLPLSTNYFAYYFSSPVSEGYKLSKGIGLSYWYLYEFGGIKAKLYSAVISGKQYGETVGLESKRIINKYELELINYPNPFNPTTIIEYSIPEASFVILDIYNSLGEKVSNLVSQFQSAGNYKINFSGKELSSGIYFYKLSTGFKKIIKKMILLK